MNTLFIWIGGRKDFILKLQTGTIIRQFGTQNPKDILNANASFDFQNIDVGTTVIASYPGSTEVGAYSIVIGKVVD